MKKFLKFGAVALATTFAVAGLASCGSDSSATTTKSAVTTTPVAAETSEDAGEDAGFSEVEIFSDVEMEFLHLNAVYFQPVDMTGGYKAADYDCHLELDVSALKNGYGYGVGDWVPYLTVEYKVEKDGAEVCQGTFMPMSASDGPHYGQNIKLAGDGLYSVTFTIKFPDSNTYLIHTDSTGPESSVYPDTIVYTYDQWTYTNGAWNE